MGHALKAARCGAEQGEIPVGAVVVDPQGIILTQAHNQCIALHDPSAHAEILALRQAGQKLQNYRLQHCVLVVTLEPCLMCTGAIVHSRIAGVVYGAADIKTGAISSCCDGLQLPFHNHTAWHMGGVRSDECALLLQTFFGRDTL